MIFPPWRDKEKVLWSVSKEFIQFFSMLPYQAATQKRNLINYLINFKNQGCLNFTTSKSGTEGNSPSGLWGLRLPNCNHSLKEIGGRAAVAYASNPCT